MIDKVNTGVKSKSNICASSNKVFVNSSQIENYDLLSNASNKVRSNVFSINSGSNLCSSAMNRNLNMTDIQKYSYNTAKLDQAIGNNEDVSYEVNFAYQPLQAIEDYRNSSYATKTLSLDPNEQVKLNKYNSQMLEEALQYRNNVDNFGSKDVNYASTKTMNLDPGIQVNLDYDTKRMVDARQYIDNVENLGPTISSNRNVVSSSATKTLNSNQNMQSNLNNSAIYKTQRMGEAQQGPYAGSASGIDTQQRPSSVLDSATDMQQGPYTGSASGIDTQQRPSSVLDSATDMQQGPYAGSASGIDTQQRPYAGSASEIDTQ